MENTKKCAPGKFDKENDTCFTLEQLQDLAKAYNLHYTKNALTPGEKNNNLNLMKISDNKRDLLKQFREIFNADCKDNAICINKQQLLFRIVKEMKNEACRIDGPKNRTDWLWTNHIDGILKQYESMYPDFRFLGAIGLDCENHSFCKLHKFDITKCKNDNIRKLGVVYNLDKYGEPGSHWVALYCDLGKCQIYYCDSVGRPPHRHIKNFIEQFKIYCGDKVDYQYNTKKYQLDDSECGIYCCNFIIRMLYGESFESIIKNSLSFKEINSCRNLFFSNNDGKWHKLCDPHVN